jgi:hypothetical protein
MLSKHLSDGTPEERRQNLFDLMTEMFLPDGKGVPQQAARQYRELQQGSKESIASESVPRFKEFLCDSTISKISDRDARVRPLYRALFCNEKAIEPTELAKALLHILRTRNFEKNEIQLIEMLLEEKATLDKESLIYFLKKLVLQKRMFDEKKSAADLSNILALLKRNHPDLTASLFAWAVLQEKLERERDDFMGRSLPRHSDVPPDPDYMRPGCRCGGTCFDCKHPGFKDGKPKNVERIRNLAYKQQSLFEHDPFQLLEDVRAIARRALTYSPYGREQATTDYYKKKTAEKRNYDDYIPGYSEKMQKQAEKAVLEAEKKIKDRDFRVGLFNKKGTPQHVNKQLAVITKAKKDAATNAWAYVEALSEIRVIAREALEQNQWTRKEATTQFYKEIQNLHYNTLGGP